MAAAILVATWDDGLFVVSRDACAHELAGQAVRGLAADGRGGALAVVGGHALCRREPGGAWETVATTELALSCCMAVGDAIYVGTDDARMLRLIGDKLDVLDGFDRVAGRETWFAGWAIVNGQRMGPPLGIRTMAANANGSVLFANVHVGGIPRSTDGGRTWEPTIDVLADVHEVCVHPSDPEVVVAAAAAGLCVSRDAGATWSVEQEGLHDPHCYAVAIAGDDVFVSSATDPFSAAGQVYRRSLTVGGVLAVVEGGMPAWTDGAVHSGCMAARGALVAAADRGGNVYASEDFGRTWTCRIDGLPAPSGVIFG